jgi:phosphoketolase
MPDRDFDALFTLDKPVILAFHTREHGENDPAIANWTWPTAPDRD